VPTKEYTVKFYAGAIGPDGQHASIAAALLALNSLPQPFVIGEGENTYFVKDLEVWNQNRSFRGVFAKVRMTGLPHIGDTGGIEQELNLEPTEGLLEKNHFIFTSRRHLLSYQENFFGPTSSMLGKYLTKFVGAAVDFGPVIKADALQRLMNGGTEMKKLELTLARPTNPAMFPANDFSQSILDLMQSTDSMSIQLNLSANGPGQRGNTLTPELKNIVRTLINRNAVRSARATVLEEGQTVPLDLIADRIAVRKDIEMDGRYPVPTSIYAALEEARQEVSSELDEYFGED
jgi:hypothetical protein